MARIAKEANEFSLHRVYGSQLCQGKRWYSLSSQMVGRKVGQFVKGKFFEVFPSEITRVRIDELWRENGEHVPFEWFSLRNREEAYVVSLFGLVGGLVKQSSTADSGHIASDNFNRIVGAINNLDISEADDYENISTINSATPKSQRIAILEKELTFFRNKVSQVESSLMAVMETPPETPLLSTKAVRSNLESIATSSIGPITKKREMRAVCSLAFEDIDNAFSSNYGSLGAILGYGFLYGKDENQLAVNSAISEAVEIVSLNKGLEAATNLALSPELKQKQLIATRVPDWVQVYVKLETKLPDSGWQTILYFLNLGRSGVSCCFT